MSDSNGKPNIFEGTLEEIVAEFMVRPNQTFLEKIDGSPSVEINHALLEAIVRMMSRTEEEILAARERIFARSPKPTPIPPGKTWEDMVVGKWPGDETDEEIREALERLS